MPYSHSVRLSRTESHLDVLAARQRRARLVNLYNWLGIPKIHPTLAGYCVIKVKLGSAQIIKHKDEFKYSKVTINLTVLHEHFKSKLEFQNSGEKKNGCQLFWVFLAVLPLKIGLLENARLRCNRSLAMLIRQSNQQNHTAFNIFSLNFCGQ